MNRQKLFLGFSVLFFQQLRKYSRKNSLRNQSSCGKLLLSLCLVTQSLYDTSEKQDERIVAGFFYQVLDDWKSLNINYEENEIKTLFERYNNFFTSELND